MALRLYGDGNIENVDSIVTSASATLSATELGYIDGVTSALQTQLNNAGKILQIVRATDGTSRSSNSTSFVDASLSVTITPTKSTSAVILIVTLEASTSSTVDTTNLINFQITDNSNNAISGAEDIYVGVQNFTGSGFRASNQYNTFVAYATPATTSATTYKLRYKTQISTVTAYLDNSSSTAQMFAIEVSA